MSAATAGFAERRAAAACVAVRAALSSAWRSPMDVARALRPFSFEGRLIALNRAQVLSACETLTAHGIAEKRAEDELAAPHAAGRVVYRLTRGGDVVA